MARKLSSTQPSRRSTASASSTKRERFITVETDAQLNAARKRKTWTEKDCVDVTPLTDTQREVFQCWYQRSDSHLALTGSAGTGKSYVGCYLAINDVLNPETDQKRLIIIRSAVPTRSSGFLPGSREEKEEIYQAPYKEIFSKLFKRASTFEDMVDAGVIEFVTTSYIRGVTFDNCIILVDEIQSMTQHEIDSVCTRLGKNSRIMLVGDSRQDDLHSKKGTEVSGFDYAISTARHVSSFDIIKFTHDDIVRSGFVKDWIIASEGF
jgi:predicted ribonuclease YlaK